MWPEAANMMRLVENDGPNDQSSGFPLTLLSLVIVYTSLGAEVRAVSHPAILMPVIRIAMRYACVPEIPKEIKCQLSFAIHTHEIAITSHPKEALPFH